MHHQYEGLLHVAQQGATSRLTTFTDRTSLIILKYDMLMYIQLWLFSCVH